MSYIYQNLFLLCSQKLIFWWQYNYIILFTKLKKIKLKFHSIYSYKRGHLLYNLSCSIKRTSHAERHVCMTFFKRLFRHKWCFFVNMSFPDAKQRWQEILTYPHRPFESRTFFIKIEILHTCDRNNKIHETRDAHFRVRFPNKLIKLLKINICL